MNRDGQLAIVDVAMTIGFIVLAIAAAWWWALFAVGSACVGYRQLRLTLRVASRPDASAR